MQRNTRNQRKSLLWLVVGFVAILLLWDTPIVYPIKLFVVLMHEISHGLAAVATGGSIVRIEVNAAQGGVCWTQGGIRFIVASAGYLGSLLWGAALFLIAAKTRLDRPLAGLLGLFILGITVFYIRNWFGFGFGLLTGLALLAAAIKLPRSVVEIALKLLGLTSCLYAIVDIKSDTISRQIAGSDAGTMAELTGIPSILWGVLWILISLVITAGVVYVGAFRSRQR